VCDAKSSLDPRVRHVDRSIRLPAARHDPLARRHHRCDCQAQGGLAWKDSITSATARRKAGFRSSTEFVHSHSLPNPPLLERGSPVAGGHYFPPAA
jgi:hypothetical protein